MEHYSRHTSPKRGTEGVSVADESVIGYDLRSRVKKSIKDYDASTMLFSGETVQQHFFKMAKARRRSRVKSTPIS